MVLTRSAIINGKKHYEKVEFKKLKDAYGDGELKLGHLTDGDLSEIENLMQNGGINPISMSINPDPKDRNKQAIMAKQKMDILVDPIESEKARYDADVLAVCRSLNNADENEGWTEDDIKRWPAGSVREVALKIYEISGVDDPDLTRRKVKDFREETQKSSN